VLELSLREAPVRPPSLGADRQRAWTASGPCSRSNTPARPAPAMPSRRACG